MLADMALAWHDVALKLGSEGSNFLRLVVACGLGGLIGMERSVHGQSAGLRTQMLVAVGSALAMIVSLEFGVVFGNTPAANMSVDPARVAYGVMGGIGFLGAGTIMRYGLDIHGLTTAASLWCTAAVGLACGFGMYSVAIYATILVLVVLWGLKVLDRALPKPIERTLILTAGRESIEQARRLIEESRVRIRSSTFWYPVQQGAVRATFRLSARTEKPVHELAHQLSLLEDVRQLRMH
jgi:putative Mg2+ transporter-C (MgtC) family protein